MAYMKQLHDLQTTLNSVVTDIDNSASPTTDLSALQDKLNTLKVDLCGAMNTMYAYTCNCDICRNKCTMELNHVLTDLTFCLDSLDSGMGMWTQTGTRVIT